MKPTRGRKLLAGAALGVASLVLGACWPVPGQNADRTAHNAFEAAFSPDTVPDLEERWTASLGPDATGPVVVDRGGAFVRTGDTVTRLQLSSGAEAWSWQLPDDQIGFGAVSDPLVVDGRVLIGHGFGNLGGHWFGVSLDPVTGQPAPGTAVSGLLQTARGPIVATVTYGFGTLTPVAIRYGLTDVTGASTVNGGLLAIESSGSGVSRLTVGTDAVYHAGNGLLSDGAGGLTLGSGVRRFPLAPATTCGPPSATLFACPTWATPLVTTTDVVIGPGGVLYVGQAGGSVAALSASTGAVLWTAAVGATVTATPALADGVLYVPTADGDLVAVDADGCGAATCDPLWSAAIDGTAINEQPAVSGAGDDAVVFVGTSGGTVAAVAACGCGEPTCDTPLWQASVGAEVTGAPAVSGGKVVVGTSTGDVVAFGLP
jgi:outer membrane protein assembly factor BamB